MEGTSAVDRLLEIDALCVALVDGLAPVPLLYSVTLSLGRREVLGVVGESGSGKSMLALAVLGLMPDHIRVTGGSIRLDGREMVGLPEPALRAVRGAHRHGLSRSR